MTAIRRAIRHVRAYTLTKQVKKKQRKWQRSIDIQEGTEFCPLLYKNCTGRNGNDANCFSSKAPGCPTYIKYIKNIIQNQNPAAHVTREDALEYISTHS